MDRSRNKPNEPQPNPKITTQVNINVCCPSKAISNAQAYGAYFLDFPQAVVATANQVQAGTKNTGNEPDISVKCRIGTIHAAMFPSPKANAYDNMMRSVTMRGDHIEHKLFGFHQKMIPKLIKFVRFVSKNSAVRKFVIEPRGAVMDPRLTVEQARPLGPLHPSIVFRLKVRVVYLSIYRLVWHKQKAKLEMQSLCIDQTTLCKHIPQMQSTA